MIIDCHNHILATALPPGHDVFVREMRAPGHRRAGRLPAYRAAKTTEEKLEAVHRTVLALLDAFGLEVPEYLKARTAAERAEALGRWLSEQEGYLLKPMNCPHHIQIYKAQPRSYRDLPVRLAEFGTVYRFEQSGELSGMTRVRGFTQDDAHIFCRPDQVEEEINRALEFSLYVLRSMRLQDFKAYLSTRPEKYVGDPADWDMRPRAS